MEKYQTVGRRFIALIIDSFITIPLTYIPVLFFSFELDSKFAFVLISSVNILVVFYYILFHAIHGQTLGKMAMKVRVLDVSEKPVSFAQSVIRSLPQMFPVFISASVSITDISSSSQHGFGDGLVFGAFYFLYAFWQIADIIVCLSSEKKRALHDLIAGTVVVRTDNVNLSINSQP